MHLVLKNATLQCRDSIERGKDAVYLVRLLGWGVGREGN